ncbi:cobalt-precorrin-6A reductase [Roseibium polysiphoniae]|uniref:Cobalt-precorrin-6A reductase n=1 Tax=Roseibium polysiphoniae TaxID=2571221 RepID=A0A944CGW5_9HYPH|nr:cobalt-precorrin-6A reductase [Roseibium polysiphoniae]MBS8262407.1 cobalt-precorrin-6A reductase [Roseibium polysiphoniae]
MSSKPKILLLAGTQEARQLAPMLSKRIPHAHVTASFAGVVRDLPDLGVETRVGGFGGAEGLLDYLRQTNTSLVIDATHPYAAQMSWNAAKAAMAAGVALLRLDRPLWQPIQDDNWINAGDLRAANQLLPSGSRAFLSVGRKEVSVFFDRSDMWALARMIEPPPVPLPATWHLELARPGKSVEEEIQLLQRHKITHVVSKNSGGERSYAKIEAARSLGLPVIMVARPKLPNARNYAEIDKLCIAIKNILEGAEPGRP